MEKLKYMKETLMSAVYSELGDLKNADTKELGEVIDMIKDLEEAIYYCTIVEAMEDKDEHKKSEKYYYYYPERDMDKNYGRMYYPPMTYYDYNGNENGNSSSRNYPMTYADNSSMRNYPTIEMRDTREGRSGSSRKNYMEAKEMHHDKTTKMHELEKYMQELTKDLVEMIEGSSPEEKQLLQRKLTALGTKIEQVNV